MKKRLLCLLLALTAVFSLVVPAYAEDSAALEERLQQVLDSGSYWQSEARSMLSLINAMRSGDDAWYWDENDAEKIVLTDLEKLSYDYALEQIAMRRAAELVLSFSHTRPDGTSCFSATYEGVSSWAENIAYGYPSAQSAFIAWSEEDYPYAGQGHRRNMLDSDRIAIGIACFYYGGRYYWVQEFGFTNSGIADPLPGAATGSGLSAPKLSSVTNVSGGVQIQWNPVPGADSYRVFYKTGDAGWKKAGDSYYNSFLWTGAKPGTTYSFTVRCLDSSGSYASSYDKTGLSVTTPAASTALAAPTVSVSHAPTGIKVSWNKVSGAAKYKVYYKEAGGSWKAIGSTTATSYTFTAKRGVGGTKYQFAVRCVDSQKNLISTYEASESIQFIGIPQVTVKNVSNGIQVSWNKVSGAAKYKVYYKEAGGSWKAIGSTTATSYTFTAKRGVSGTKYQFAVRCVDSKGSLISSYNASKTITFQ